MQTKDDILSMPGIKLDLIGKVENRPDSARILDYLNASEDVRREASVALTEPLTMIGRRSTPELADRLSRLRDRFDRFGYVRAIKETSLAAQ